MMDRWVDSGSKFHHVPLSLGIKTTKNLNSLKKKGMGHSVCSMPYRTFPIIEKNLKRNIYTHTYICTCSTDGRLNHQELTQHCKSAMLLLPMHNCGFSCVRLCGASGLQPARFLCPWGPLGRTTGVGCHALLQGIFPIQGSNLGLLHCR